MNIYCAKDTLTSIDHNLLRNSTQSYKIAKQIRNDASDTSGKFLKIYMIDDRSPFYETQEHSENETISPVTIVIFKKRKTSKIFAKAVIISRYIIRVLLFFQYQKLINFSLTYTNSKILRIKLKLKNRKILTKIKILMK